jgi:hypothetical protein
MLKLKGSQHFRQRLVLATLTGKSIRIDDIRAKDQNPGLRDFEASLLRLIEKITNGCIVEINETGAFLLCSAFKWLCMFSLVNGRSISEPSCLMHTQELCQSW